MATKSDSVPDNSKKPVKKTTPAKSAPASAVTDKSTKPVAKKTAAVKTPAAKAAEPAAKAVAPAAKAVEPAAKTAEHAAKATAHAAGDSREERIRDAAYRRYAERGFTHGDPHRDWLDAEAEVDGLKKKA